MPNILNKFLNSIKVDGPFKALVKTANYPFVRFRRKYFTKKVLDFNSVEERFTWIYKNNHWDCDESVSGSGSTLAVTKNLRQELPALIERFSIGKVFDAPCGDFNWMRHLLATIDVDYVGGDIVKPLVDDLNGKFQTSRTSFIQINLITQKLPKADLMICRDCLFHLSYQDTKAVLENFVQSGTKYLLTTTHKNVAKIENRDIKTGDFRLMNLFSAPYNFPLEPLARIDDWVAPEPERQMCLWSRDQVSLALGKWSD